MEEDVFFLKATLLFGEQPIKILEKHPVEDAVLGMMLAIDSCSIDFS